MNATKCPFCGDSVAVYVVGAYDDKTGCHNCGYRVSTTKWNDLQARLAKPEARIRELEEVMPLPCVLRSWALDADLPAFYIGAHGVGKELLALADRIERVMKKKN